MEAVYSFTNEDIRLAMIEYVENHFEPLAKPVLQNTVLREGMTSIYGEVKVKLAPNMKKEKVAPKQFNEGS